jgi:hypothetical protein
VGETTLAMRVARSGGPGMLVPANRVRDVEQALPDGSWLSRLYAAGDRPAGRCPVRVRVVAYAFDDPGGAARASTGWSPTCSTTSGTRPTSWPRSTPNGGRRRPLWTRSRPTSAARVVLTSKIPDGIRQQVWAQLLVHHALRALMCRTGRTAGVDCDQLSFTDTLRIVRAASPPRRGCFPLSPW